ncbi:hypothetical protein XH9_03380 [Glutamicibacter mysorens]|nr:hypothetical protein XH9_03380 [Glutamicibacter mysorens]
MTAPGDYMRMWFQDVPPEVWLVGLSMLLIGVSMFNFKAFGTLEYWFSATKVFTNTVFILLAAYLVLGQRDNDLGFRICIPESEFFVGGAQGVWLAAVVAIVSYLSAEMIAVAAGEAKHPEVAVKNAFKLTLFRLNLYLSPDPVADPRHCTPQRDPRRGQPIRHRNAGSRYPVHRFQSQFCGHYRSAPRDARAGHTPRSLGKPKKNGAPTNALPLSAGCVTAATTIYGSIPESGFTAMTALSMLGAMMTSMRIFITHLFFRRAHRGSAAPLQ